MSAKIAKGFDRDIDYEPMKMKLIKEFEKQSEHYLTKNYITRAGNSVVYLFIAMIQLRNGSRVSEAVNAFRHFYENNYNQMAIVKIAKSGGIKVKYVNEGDKKVKKKIQTKERYRKIMFPETWLDQYVLEKVFEKLKSTHHRFIYTSNLKEKMIQYMLNNFESNTHSLRYAFINYMLYVQKRPMNDVAKFVGHVNVNQLVTYTQQKNCEQIFQLDM